MYVYYLDTRKGGRPVSRKVDRAVQRVYQIGFAELKYVNTYNPFNDPVGWLESDKPGIKISDKRPSLSKEEYVEFVQEWF